ncbi:hypothetical protein, partial [Porphyromonas endodontalis]|uniref:hypothetical protein n=1 Tax=Porphyromonas endodontalis TaxID=28124 RepID=UPI00366B1E00
MGAIFCPKTIRILSGLSLTPLLSPKNTSRRGLRIEERKKRRGSSCEKGIRARRRKIYPPIVERNPLHYHGTRETREEKKKGEKE